MKDQEVLALAAEQHRALVSHDVGTMRAHFREFRDAGMRKLLDFGLAKTAEQT